jgi:hypothetical protein
MVVLEFPAALLEALYLEAAAAAVRETRLGLTAWAEMVVAEMVKQTAAVQV